MKHSEITRRYSRALFLAVQQQKIVSPAEVFKQLNIVLSWIQSDKTFQFLLLHALMPVHKKKLELERYSKMKSTLLSAVVFQLLNLLFQRKRLEILSGIVDQFEREIQNSEGELKAYVRSASALSDAEKKSIVTHLSKLFGKKVFIDLSIHPELLAGAIIQAGDVVIDNSLSSKLQSLKSQFYSASSI